MVESGIDWDDENLCVHVPDYGMPLGKALDIVQLLKSILDKGLLTPTQLGRKKNHFGLTSDDTIDVWSPLLNGNRGDDPKQNLLKIVDNIGTSVTLLLSVQHDEIGKYPHSITRKTPQIVGLILSRKSQTMLFYKEFTSGLRSLSKQYKIPVINLEGKEVNLLRIEQENEML